MNIGFYDPISERWIKPRPEKQPEAPSYQSMADALMIALEAAARKERNEKIWEYLKQSAEGCNAAPVAEPEPADPPATVYYYSNSSFYVSDGKTFKVLGDEPASPTITIADLPECEPAESLGYIYWKPKETA